MKPTRTDDAEPPPGLPKAGRTAREQEALSSFLHSPAMGGRAMDLHMIQGLSAALALGPRLISPGLWLRWVWDHEQGTREPAFDDLDQFNTVAGWVMALYNDAAVHLGPAADEDD
jgi:yecA family protein